MKISLSKMYVDDRIEKAISEVLNSGRYISGQNLKSFEEEFADLCSTKYAVGVSSGTSAILLSLMALGIGAGDEIIRGRDNHSFSYVYRYWFSRKIPWGIPRVYRYRS